MTELRAFPDRGRSMGADSGWAEIAGTALDLLSRHGIGAPAATAQS